MDKPIKILLGGIVCAGILASGQLFKTRRLENQVKRIEAECITEGKREITEGGRLLCNAEDLERLKVESGHLPQLQRGDIFDQVEFEKKNPDAVNIQDKLVVAYRKYQSARRNSWFYIAALILGLSALPWLWYFLLRRIRELRDAILGK